MYIMYAMKIASLLQVSWAPTASPALDSGGAVQHDSHTMGIYFP